MSYIDNNLLPDEQVTYRSHLHWVIFIRAILWILIAVALFIVIQVFNLPAANHIPDFIAVPVGAIYHYLPLIALAIGVVTGFFNYLTFITTEVGVTTKRVIIKRGIISRITSENFLQKIENIQVFQSIIGRLLNYGTIVLYGTGGTREAFPLIDNPLKFREQIQVQVAKVLEK